MYVTISMFSPLWFLLHTQKLSTSWQIFNVSLILEIADLAEYSETSDRWKRGRQDTTRDELYPSSANPISLRYFSACPIDCVRFCVSVRQEPEKPSQSMLYFPNKRVDIVILLNDLTCQGDEQKSHNIQACKSLVRGEPDTHLPGRSRYIKRREIDARRRIGRHWNVSEGSGQECFVELTALKLNGKWQYVGG